MDAHNLSESELVAAITAALEVADAQGVLTSSEIYQTLRTAGHAVSIQRVRQLIRHLEESGQVTYCRTARRQINGVMNYVSAYRLICQARTCVVE